MAGEDTENSVKYLKNNGWLSIIEGLVAGSIPKYHCVIFSLIQQRLDWAKYTKLLNFKK